MVLLNNEKLREIIYCIKKLYKSALEFFILTIHEQTFKRR